MQKFPVSVILSLLMVVFAPSACSNDAREKAIGMWTDGGSIHALALRPDGEMWMKSSDDQGGKIYMNGRWNIEKDGRLIFEVGSKNSCNHNAKTNRLFMRLAFNGNEMIHTPEQGKNVGKKIWLKPIPNDLAAQHELAFRWRTYAGYLEALREPKISIDSDNHKTFRVTMLPSFDRPLCVRFNIREDGQGAAISKRLHRKDGHGPVELEFVHTRNLTKKDTGRLLLAVYDSKILSMAAAEDHQGVDGTTWILEGWSKGAYHAVTRWDSGSSNRFLELCISALEVGGLKEHDAYPPYGVPIDNQNTEQIGAEQPTTTHDSKPEDEEKPKPKSEARTQ